MYYLCIRIYILRNNIMPEYDIALELAKLHILKGGGATSCSFNRLFRKLYEK